MRIATYKAPPGPVEVSVTRFPGRVGGELANINRWRGQLGLTPIEAADLDRAINRFTTTGFDGYEVRIESPGKVMLAVAVYEAAGDHTWFVRATLPDAAAADQLQPDLFGMARSITTRAEREKTGG